jgi:RHS repeat-associated protein
MTRANDVKQRVILLATDSNQSIIGENVEGKVNTIGYSAYGEQSAQQEVASALGFNGQLREAKLGWYLLGNGYRAYNTRLMRFHSPDSWSPFGGGGLNAYMYCVGDPVNRVDPTGHGWLSLAASLLDRMGVVMPKTRPIDHIPFAARTAKQFNALNLPNVPSTALDITIGMRPEKTGELAGLAGVGAPVFAPKPKVNWVGNNSAGDWHTAANWGADNYPVSGTRTVATSGSKRSARPSRVSASSTSQPSRHSIDSFDLPRTEYSGPDPVEPRIEHLRLLGGEAPLPPNYWKGRPPQDQPPTHQPQNPAPQMLGNAIPPQEARDRHAAAVALLRLGR